MKAKDTSPRATKKKPLIIGNWKMNPKTVGDAKRLFLGVQSQVSRLRNVEIVIAPPFPYIAELRKLGIGRRILLGAQNVHPEAQGALTGEVSVPMLESLDVSHFIVGHSERREMGENDELIAKKVRTVLKAKKVAVLCVGERERDAHGRYLGFVEAQLHSALVDVVRTQLQYLVIAYEPIWAIGTGNNATPEDAHEMLIFIQRFLTQKYNRNIAMNTTVLYGGSVNARNAKELLEGSQMQGFLVGGASLKATEFVEILKVAHKHRRHERA